MKILDFLKKECGFTENFETPTALMARLLKDPDELFDSYIKEFKDLSFDNFTNYFQDNHSNRNDFLKVERQIQNIEKEINQYKQMKKWFLAKMFINEK